VSFAGEMVLAFAAGGKVFRDVVVSLRGANYTHLHPTAHCYGYQGCGEPVRRFMVISEATAQTCRPHWRARSHDSAVRGESSSGVTDR
jgi:hypothetical protein